MVEDKNAVRLTVAGDGLFKWLAWALFKWNGHLRRLDYLVAIGFFILLSILYVCAVSWVYVSFFVPPPDGAAVTMEYILDAFGSDQVPVYLLLPLTCTVILIDAKRLRSFGASPLIAVALNGINFFRPDEGPMTTMLGLVALVYLICLLFIPPKTKSEPVAAGATGTTASGDGQWTAQGWQSGLRKPRPAPRIYSWRVVAPAPRKEGQKDPTQDGE